MIPIKLHLRNFMSYRGASDAIDFSGIHLACVVGDNGHGKSALLDAMTWALWGKARARRDDDLITRGETDMEVHFDFDLGSDRYRVIRKRTSRGRGSSMLELQVRHNGMFKPLSEPAIRETQQKIVELLRLDYDTFVNSAFLLQGRADEFSTKRPAERKQILSDILGLAIYDTYADRARERARQAEDARLVVERELAEIEEWVKKIPDLQQEVVEAESRAIEIANRLRAEETILHGLREQRRELDRKAERLAEEERRETTTTEQLVTLRRRVAERHERLRRYDDLLARAVTIETGYRQWVVVREECEHWNTVIRRLVELQNEQGAAQRALDTARGRVEADLRVAERDVADLRGRASREEELRQVYTQARAELDQLESLQRDQQAHQEALSQAREQKASLEGENTHLMTVMQDLRERLTLLEREEGAACPVCRQPLSPEHRRQVLAEVQAEGKERGDRYRENGRCIRELTNRIAVLEGLIKDNETRLRQLGQWQAQVARGEQALGEAQQAAAQLAAAEQKATILRGQLERKEYALDVQEQLATLADETRALGYNRDRHENARTRLQELQLFEREHNDLVAARERREDEQGMVETLQQQVASWETRLREIQTEVAALRQALAERSALDRRYVEQRDVVTDLQQQATLTQRHLGAARQNLEFAEQQAAKQADKARELDHWNEERTSFSQLQYAFGKRGIQAMLIETAIPEIEEEANGLLGRMTDGRMNVRVETQREGRTTDAPIETLDIIIADEQGERPYELFSGGEAFRINFALRIALSRLLARRAGARLQTLVIDEGFGTQDAQGRERLVEAITAVQDDFERILVITHLDDLKDAFPVRIDVVKGPSGSRVNMN